MTSSQVEAGSPRARQTDRGQAALLVAVLVAGAALRPQLSGVGPLIDPIRRSLHVSHGVAGLLSTIPVLCMGLCAFAAPRLLAAHGARRVMTWSLVLIVVGGLLRSVAPGVALILVLTAVFGIGAGFAGALLPSIIKERFASQAMLVTGISAIAINGAAAVAAAVAVPLAGGSGQWRPALAAFGVWDVGLALAWVALTQRRAARPAAPVPITSAGERRLPWERGRVWAIALVFGLQGTVYYGLNAWLAAAAKEHGWSAGAGGVLVALLNFTTLPATLVAAWAAGRVVSKRAYLILASAGLLLATVGLAAAPAADWLWPSLAGLALGSIFPICMSLPLDLGRDPAQVAGITAIMLGFGYSFAALAPLALGEARDASGSFTAGMWMLAGLAVLLVGVCALFARRPAEPEPSAS